MTGFPALQPGEHVVLEPALHPLATDHGWPALTRFSTRYSLPPQLARCTPGLECGAPHHLPESAPLLGAPAMEPGDLVGDELFGIAGDIAEAVEEGRDGWMEVTDVTATADDDGHRVIMLATAEGGTEVRITVELTGRTLGPGEPDNTNDRDEVPTC